MPEVVLVVGLKVSGFGAMPVEGLNMKYSINNTIPPLPIVDFLYNMTS